MQISVYTDGGSRGNPGISGYGFIIYDHLKKIICQESKFLGVKTNNEAEYLGLIASLTWVSQHQSDLDGVKVYSDSELLTRQLNGSYRVKSAHLKPLYQIVLNLISGINSPITFHHIPRELNWLADSLANQAMDFKHAS